MANGLCTSCQGLQRVIDQWKKRDELDRYRADAAEAEVDRLRAANEHLADALEDIAGMLPTEDPEVDPERWVATGDCAGMNHVCHMEHPEDPDEWCPTCVAEIAWCAWKMGGLG